MPTSFGGGPDRIDTMPAMPADPWGSNRGDPSTYNQWADITPTTYQQYIDKFRAGQSNVNNPLAAWLTSGASPLSEHEWTAQNAQSVASPNTWGGGDTAASDAAHAARVAAALGPLSQLQSAGPNPAPANVMQAGTPTFGGGQSQPQPQFQAQPQPFQWNPQQGGGFNTPVLDSLYQGQQQRMASQAPTFNFQAKPGALTRVTEG